MVDENVQEPVEGNPDEVDSTEEQDLEEIQEETQIEEEKTPEEPSYYTAEEMKALDPKDVDTSRIPPEQLPFYKSMQAGWGNKFTELADLKKDILSKGKDTTDQLPDAGPQNIFDAYVADQQAVTGHIDKEIQKARSDEDDSRVEELRELKNSLRDYKMANLERQRKEDIYVQEVRAEIVKAIPNFSSKMTELADFAVDMVPDDENSREYLKLLTHPGAVVKLGGKEVRMPAVWFSKFVDAAFNKVKPLKQSRKTPSKPISPGSGHSLSTTSVDLNKELEKAREIGTPEAWAVYMGLKRIAVQSKKKK